MKFCIPSKFPTYQHGDDIFDCWKLVLNLPYIFAGDQYDLGDTIKVWKIYAPTEITWERSDCYHRFKVTFLGFGISYSRQWGY